MVHVDVFDLPTRNTCVPTIKGNVRGSQRLHSLTVAAMSARLRSRSRQIQRVRLGFGKFNYFSDFGLHSNDDYFYDRGPVDHYLTFDSHRHLDHCCEVRGFRLLRGLAHRQDPVPYFYSCLLCRGEHARK